MKCYGIGIKSASRRLSRFMLLLPASMAFAAMFPAASFGQQANASLAANNESAGGLAEIVVTAQRREESLQNVPLSITALNSDQLTQLGITGVGSLLGGQIPSVRILPFAGNPTVLEVGIRGIINLNGNDVTNENPVPIYIDDVYYGRQNAFAMELNDIERLEVLRGPQGTLFGKNAAGGAIRVVSKDPTGTLGLTQQADGGNFGYYKAITHLNLPSVGNFATKINFLATDRNGWTSNPAPDQQDYGVLKSLAAGAQVLWTPDEHLRMMYAFDWTQIKSTETWNQQLSTSDPYAAWPNQAGGLAGSEPYPTYRPLDDQKYLGHRLTANWNISNSLNLKSITAYRQDDGTFYNTSQNAASYPGVFLRLPPSIPYLTGVIPDYQQKHDQLSEELQLTGNTDTVQWVGGAFFLHEDAEQLQTTYFGTIFPDAITSGPPAFLPVSLGQAVALTPPNLIGPLGRSGADAINKSYALFGQATWRPQNTRWAFTGGLRVGRDEKEGIRQSGGVWATVPYETVPGIPSSAPPPSSVCTTASPCTAQYSGTRALPLAVAEYHWSDNLSNYFRFATGYQAASLSVSSQLFRFDRPVTVDSYELGLKSEFFDHRARLNLAAFYMITKNPHQGVQTTSTSTVEFYNGQEKKTAGFELDAALVPVDGLTISAALNYLNVQQAPSPNPYPPPAGVGGVPLQSFITVSPKWTGSLLASYEVAHFSFGTLRANADANATSSYYTNAHVTRANPGYTLINSRLALTEINLGRGGKLELAAWIKNLANRNYLTYLYDAPGVVGTGEFGVFGDPRTFGGSAIYRF